MVYPSSPKISKQNSQIYPIRILIVDDRQVVRAKLQDILDNQPSINLIAAVNDGDKAICAIEKYHPDVVLMDVEMPRMNGIEATKIIHQRFSNVKILMLIAHEGTEYIQKSISAGADGYILKHALVSDLIAAINAVSKGYSFFGSKVLKKAQSIDRQSHQKEISQNTENNSAMVKINKAQTTTALSPVNTEEFLPSIDRWLTWGSLFVVTTLALAVPATSILKYKTTVKAQATVRPAGELRLVQAATEGQIEEILVEQNQTVDRGDILATMDSSHLQTRKKQLEKAIAQQRLQLLRLDSQIQVLKSQIISETESNNSEILAAKAELNGNRRSYSDRNIEANAQVKQANAQLESARSTLKAAQTKAIRYRSVASQGSLSQEQLAEAELEVQQQQQQIAAAEAELQNALAALNPSTAEIEMAQQRIQQIGKSGQANIARLHREKETIIRQQIEINQQLEQDIEELSQTETDLLKTNLTATAKGTISVLNLRNPGQAIQAGQEVAQIIPSNAPLEIKATISPQDIAKLETNQKVQMKVSACPYPDYGVLNGTVSKIARDITQSQNSNRGNNSQSDRATPAFFEVTIAPQESSFGRGERICDLQLGMEGNTNIVTREESVLQFILRKARLISQI